MRYILILFFFLMGCSYSDVFQEPRDYYFKTLPLIRDEIRLEAKELIGESKGAVISRYGQKPKNALLEKNTKMRDFKTSVLYDCDELWTYRVKRKTKKWDSHVFRVDFCFADEKVLAVNVD